MPVPCGQRLFLYGTLLAGARTPMARALEARVSDQAAATVPGRLVAIPAVEGWYPALIQGGPGRVNGTICTLRPDRAFLASLDRYEGGQYRREFVWATRTGGLPERALAYVWQAPLPPGARPIAGGDFLEWIARSGKRPFGLVEETG